jgi:deoxyribose-phosphate aldolase
MKQLVLVNETAGPEWLTPSLFRIGASALLNDLLMQRMKLDDGYYASPQYVTID